MLCCMVMCSIYMHMYLYQQSMIRITLRVKCCKVVQLRAESGLDDLANLGHLGHLFGGLGGSHPQTKLYGCDQDITCSVSNMI